MAEECRHGMNPSWCGWCKPRKVNRGEGVTVPSEPPEGDDAETRIAMLEIQREQGYSGARNLWGDGDSDGIPTIETENFEAASLGLLLRGTYGGGQMKKPVKEKKRDRKRSHNHPQKTKDGSPV